MQEAINKNDKIEKVKNKLASVNIIEKIYNHSPQSVKVLSNLAFEIYRGEILGMLGPSGCGKTTLLRLISGLDKDYKGEIFINDQSIKVPGIDRGIMFQEARLLPWFNVLQNVTFALPINTSKEEANKRAKSALAKAGFQDDIKALPHQLSEGMLKRVAFARAIVNLPQLLLLDEPLTALDEPSKFILQDEIIKSRNDENEMTILLVTHDVEEAVFISNRILILSQKPSHLIREISITLDYPRDRTSDEFQEACKVIVKYISTAWK
jgi:sulfonate transport system ATP-binding protein